MYTSGRLKKIIFIILLIYFQTSSAWITVSLSQSDSIIFYSFAAENQITSPYNDFIFTDSRGLTWISSVDGIFQFDGKNIRKYSSRQVETGLIDDNVQSNFFERTNGNIWFSTYNGLNCYDREMDVFRSYQISDSTENTITENYCLFYLERDTLLWLRVGRAIYTYNITSKRSEKIIDTKGARFAVTLDDQDRVSQIYACLWNNGPGFEWISIDRNHNSSKNFIARKLRHNCNHLEIIGASTENPEEVYLFSSQGLLVFDPNDPDHFENISTSNNETGKITAGLEVNGDLTVAIKNSGLYYLQSSFPFLQQWNTNKVIDNINSTTDDIRALYFDQNELLWTSSLKGIQYAWPYRNRFQNPLPGQFISQVNSIVEDKKAKIWCATEQNGIYVFSQSGKLIEHLSYSNTPQFNQRAPIKQLSVNASGGILALSRDIISKYDPKLRNWSTLLQAKGDRFYSMLPISDSNLMITTMYSDSILIINQYNFQTEIYRPFPKTYGIQILKKVDDLLYLSDNISNVYRLNYEQQQFTIIDTLSIDADVYSITAIPENKEAIWLGTLNGISQVNLQTGKTSGSPNQMEFEKIKETPVFSLEVDDKGKLWFSTNNNIWYYTPRNGSVGKFQIDDGLPNDKFVINVSLKSANGNLWFGTKSGIFFFDPLTIKPYPYGPKIFIRSLEIDNVPYNSKPVINEVSNLTLKYYQNKLDFEVYCATSYLPQLAELYFQFSGHHQEWEEVKNNQILFEDLPSGNYTLNIQALNANGIRGPVKSIHLEIMPPFWDTWTFRSIVVLLLFGLLYSVIKYSVYRQLRRERAAFERQRALQNERNRIASELHDDLGSGLSIIRFLSESGTTQHQLGELLQTINKIASTSTELLEKMSDIIWAMNTSNDYLENLIIYLRRYAYEYLDTHGITCVFERPEKIPEIELSGKVRRNILLSFKEILHNVVKHAGATSVQVMLHFETSLIISIQDNGRGFSGQPSPTSGGGNGLINIQKRMNEIQGSATFLGQDGLQVILQTPIAPGSSKAQQKL